MAIQDLIQRGTRWRIGSSERIKVWGDAWLLDEDNPTVVTPCIEGMEGTMVNSLILPNARWNFALIDTYSLAEIEI
ncbi:conserved hypothetical protein [Ricinus communis]|uniref:Uncharacterized protein n=1 Tax=Ricinus communis TaxID=3988 RepID=B9SBA6_RICCO|nr:conserved hypothetical protein [Ricinus communis]